MIWTEKRGNRMIENVRGIIGALTRLLYDILCTRQRSGHPKPNHPPSRLLSNYQMGLQLLVFTSFKPSFAKPF